MNFERQQLEPLSVLAESRHFGRPAQVLNPTRGAVLQRIVAQEYFLELTLLTCDGVLRGARWANTAKPAGLHPETVEIAMELTTGELLQAIQVGRVYQAAELAKCLGSSMIHRRHAIDLCLNHGRRSLPLWRNRFLDNSLHVILEGGSA